MRKRMILFSVVAGLVACTNDDVLEKTVDKEEMDLVQYDPNRRSYAEALEIAQQSINMFVSDEARGATPTRKISLDKTKYVIKEAESRSGGQDTLMYIFNFEDNQGFSVISANKATEALLAQTEQGIYDENTETENPAFGMYMDMAEMYIANTRDSKYPPIQPGFKEYRIIRDTTETIRMNPKVTTQWGQTGCEATYTPNRYSGCSNTAMAQIMSYFCYPTQIAINYSGATISSLALNWSAIKTHKVSHDKQSCNASNDTHNTIGHLLRQLGHLNCSNYTNENGTITNIYNVKSTFSSFGYTTSDLIYYSGENLYPLLADNKLIYIGGQDNDIKAGHAWVIDGYLQHKIVASEWTREMGAVEWELLEEYDPYYTGYYHMNWGEDGDCNGYFQTDVFALNGAFEYDNTNNNYNNTSEFNYNYMVMYFSVKR